MPVVINLDVVLATRKMSLSRLSEKTGISLVNLSLLKNNKIKAIRFSTLEAICVALNCKPGEIIDYLSDEEYGALLANENS